MAIILNTGETYKTGDKVVHEILYGGVVSITHLIFIINKKCTYQIELYKNKAAWDDHLADVSIDPVMRKTLTCHGADFDTYLDESVLTTKGFTVKKQLEKHAIATLGWDAKWQADGGLEITNVPAL